MAKIYLAGPMRGIAQYNFPAFMAAQAALEAQGHVVVSPASLDLESGFDPTGGLPEGFMEAAIRRDVEAILHVEGIAFLPGWETSSGALAELHVTKWSGKKYFYWGLSPELTLVYLDPWTYLQNKRIPLLEAEPAPSPEKLVDLVLESEDILEEALRLTSGDRQNAYGPPDQDFARTALIWTAILGKQVSAKEVALCMAGLKISRATWSDKRDHYVDLAGYARCGYLVVTSKG